MALTFWSRRELLSLSMTESGMEEGAAGWKHQKLTSTPAINGQVDAEADERDKAIAEQLATRGLLKCK